MDEFTISQLLDAGLTAEHLAVFEENEIGTQEFYSLTMEDLRILFPNKLGIALKVIRVLQSLYTYEMQCQDFNNNSGWKGQFVPAPPMVISTMQPIDSQQYCDGTSLPDSGPNSESIPLEDEIEVPIQVPTPKPKPVSTESEIHMAKVASPEFKMSEEIKALAVSEEHKPEMSVLPQPILNAAGTSMSEFKMSEVPQPEIKMNAEPETALKYEPKPPREKIKSRQQSQSLICTSSQKDSTLPDVPKIATVKADDNPKITDASEVTNIPDSAAFVQPIKVSKDLDSSVITWSAELDASDADGDENKSEKIIQDLFSNLTDPTTSTSNGGRKPIILLETQKTSKTLTIPKEHHRFVESIMNSTNSELHKLVQSTEIQVIFPRRDRETDQVKINGTTLYANRVIEEIRRIVNNRVDEYERFQTRDIDIEKSLHGYVVGRRKNNINGILERTGVTVDVPSRNSSSSIIKLCGLPEKLDEAEALVRENCNPSLPSKDVIRVRPEIKKYIQIKGKHGVSRIDEIQRASGAQIVLSGSSSDDVSELIIEGTMTAVRQARREILEVISEERNRSEIKLDVNPKYFKYFLKNSAKLLIDIEKECPGIRIHIPKRKLNTPTPNKIHLRGSLEFAQSAKDKIWNEIANIDKEILKNGHEYREQDSGRFRADPILQPKRDLMRISNMPKKRTTSYVEINSAAYSRIIGLLGRGISKIQNDFGVHVQFPKPTDSFPNLVQISGMDAVKVCEVQRLLIDLESKYLSEAKMVRPTPAAVSPPGPSRTST